MHGVDRRQVTKGDSWALSLFEWKVSMGGYSCIIHVKLYQISSTSFVSGQQHNHIQQLMYL